MRRYPIGRQGLPYAQNRVETIILRRMTQVALSGLVVSVAVSALAVSVVGDPDPGVAGELDGNVVTYVIPGSPAWRDGIRPTQRVVEFTDAGAPGGWRILTTDEEVTRGSFAATHVDVLRLYVWWAIPALVFAAFVALLGYRRHRGAAVILPIALTIAAQPLFAVGRSEITIVGGIAIFLGGALSVAAYRPWGPRSAVLLGSGLVLAGAWTVATLVAPPAFDTIDGLRFPAALGFAALGLSTVTDRRRVAEVLTDRQGAGFVDLAYFAAAVGLMAALAIVGGVPLPLLIGLGVVGVAAYPFWRRRTLAALEGVVTAPVRREATIRAIEGERGRLARDIHDAPLQELAGVIRRLEAVPGAKDETEVLRDVASHLRDVATTLYPPVLQDLGLQAAIVDHAEQLGVGRPGRLIHVSVDDLTGGSRPPADVELAAFRVVQEASANSLAHSSCHRLTIQGAVATDSVDLTIADDGTGIDPAVARAARRAGHFGLDSMRDRAQTVGADCSVRSSRSGATVSFRWERSS